MFFLHLPPAKYTDNDLYREILNRSVRFLKLYTHQKSTTAREFAASGFFQLNFPENSYDRRVGWRKLPCNPTVSRLKIAKRGPQIESVKGSGNSGFLEEDQLFYFKRAEKLTFCIYFFYRTTCKIVTLFVNASRLG